MPAKTCPDWRTVESNGPTRMKYVILGTVGEGMSSWRGAITEVLLMARRTNSSLVEPCIHEGQIKGSACDMPDSVRLSDVFELDSLLRIGPMISYEDFLRVNATSQLYWHNYYVARYGRDGGRTGNIYAVASRADVVTLIYLFRDSLCGIDPKLKTEMRQTLRFARKHEAFVQSIKSDLNLTHGYNVLQWRSEKHHNNLTKCAAAAVNMRNLPEFKDKPMLLVSDLNYNATLMWHFMNGVVPHSKLTATLDVLRVNNFIKIDDVMHKYVQFLHEPVVYSAIWDLIIAAGADNLATCYGCDRSLCHQCSYQGHFAGFVVELRSNIDSPYTPANATTDRCWMQARIEQAQQEEQRAALPPTEPPRS